jgi:hypothetical protein
MERLGVAIALHNSQVGQDHPTIIGNQYIRRLYVTVNESARVQVVERPRQRHPDRTAACIPLGWRTTVELVDVDAQLRAFHILHGEVRTATMGTVGVVPDNSHMRHVCERATLPIEAGHQRLMGVIKPLYGHRFSGRRPT